MIKHFPAKSDPDEVMEANEENEWLKDLDPETGEPSKIKRKRKPNIPAWKKSSAQARAIKRG